jgi:uncharacterized protein YutE (UPF0331/DUF86 family)
VSPGQIDRAAIRRHLAALDHAVQQLRHHQGKTLSALRSDQDATWAVERGLQLCAQNVLEIATHIVASTGRDAPDYASAFDALAELGVLPAEFAARIRGLAGFRNVVVHAYVDVDAHRVHELLNEHLDDFAVFAGHVQRYPDGLPV